MAAIATGTKRCTKQLLKYHKHHCIVNSVLSETIRYRSTVWYYPCYEHPKRRPRQAAKIRKHLAFRFATGPRWQASRINGEHPETAASFARRGGDQNSARWRGWIAKSESAIRDCTCCGFSRNACINLFRQHLPLCLEEDERYGPIRAHKETWQPKSVARSPAPTATTVR